MKYTFSELREELGTMQESDLNRLCEMMDLGFMLRLPGVDRFEKVTILTAAPQEELEGAMAKLKNRGRTKAGAGTL